jgi:hypothetical protein
MAIERHNSQLDFVLVNQDKAWDGYLHDTHMNFPRARVAAACKPVS